MYTARGHIRFYACCGVGVCRVMQIAELFCYGANDMILRQFGNLRSFAYRQCLDTSDMRIHSKLIAVLILLIIDLTRKLRKGNTTRWQEASEFGFCDLCVLLCANGGSRPILNQLFLWHPYKFRGCDRICNPVVH